MVELNLINFSITYLLLIVVLLIMKKCRIDQTKLLLVSSLRMTVQLILAGLVLTYIFQNPQPIFTILYLAAMTVFAIFITLSRNKGMNRRFKVIVAASLTATGLAVVVFFIVVVTGQNLFDPQYTIPLGGMIIGNAMTGVSLGLKSFRDNTVGAKTRMETLLNMGAEPRRILTPIAAKALETALLPTLNSMLGMGIISLPGMMTGQILAGALPTTAILYQIAIMIAICTVVCLAVFCALFLGCRTLYNKRCQLVLDETGC